MHPDKIAPLPSNGRDVRQSFHWGTGNVELSLTNKAEFNAAKPLTLMVYEGRGAGGEISVVAQFRVQKLMQCDLMWYVPNGPIEHQIDLRAVADRIDAAYVGVYGSVASGTDDADSDIDVLVVGNLSVVAAQTALKSVGRKHHKTVNVVVVTASELPRKL